MKTGDAKPWVYRHQHDHDRQAAEDHKFICACLALAYQSQGFFIRMAINPISAAPVRIGSAK